MKQGREAGGGAAFTIRSLLPPFLRSLFALEEDDEIDQSLGTSPYSKNFELFSFPKIIIFFSRQSTETQEMVPACYIPAIGRDAFSTFDGNTLVHCMYLRDALSSKISFCG